ncbi:helix-turn-helix transcriptional regulator, partial [Streptomyces sp. NPDC006372]|uniref:helix-turn-helix transcriptional regulator n=1 Tax=Streptomyces sp. NPDC006372 TaxID=3155599 RepID=UPI0033B22C80
MSELFEAVDALVASRSPLPPPTERKRLRLAHGLTLDEVATALRVRRATVGGWEAGKTEPRPPERDAYARLLKQLAQLYPPDPNTPAADTPAPEALTPEAPAPKAPRDLTTRTPTSPPPPDDADTRKNPPRRTVPVARPADSGPSPAPPHPAARKPNAQAGPPRPDDAPRFANGPLLVLDADADRRVTGYGIGGLVTDVPARSLPALVEWTLKEAQLGAEKLHGSGRDTDPLLVLTAAALERYGLPVRLTDSERLSGRLPDEHKVCRQLDKANWRLTRRGLGPWARIYRPAEGGRRHCVQLCVPSWGALDARSWGQAAELEPAELARVLGTYAARVLTPCGSTAVTGLELMTALNPPTRASEPDDSGRRHREHRPGSLGEHPMDCA